MTDTPKRPAGGNKPFSKNAGGKKPYTKKPSGGRRAHATEFKSRQRPGYQGPSGTGDSKGSINKGPRDFNERDAELALRRLPCLLYTSPSPRD